MKVVLDTSVLISAFYHPLERPCFSRDVFHFAIETSDVFVSPYILGEFREKCRAKLKMSPVRIRALLDLVEARTKSVRSPEDIVGPKRLRDKDDLPILALAAAVRADYLLTWDKDLLSLAKFRRAVILSPRSFWDHARI